MADELDFGFSLRVEGSEAALGGVKKVADAMVLAKVDAAEFGTASQKAMRKAAKEAASLLGELRGVRGEISKLVKGMGRDFERMGVKVSGVSKDFQAMRSYATGSINAITASVGKNTRSLSGMSSAAREAMKDIGKLASAKPIRLKITREVQDAVSGSSRSPANDFVSSTVTNSRGQSIPIYGSGPGKADATKGIVAKMTVGSLVAKKLSGFGGVGATAAASRVGDMGQGQGVAGSGFSMSGIASIAAAATAGLSIRNGFSGTVEGNRFETELTLLNRQLASVFKPAMNYVTKQVMAGRKAMEGLDGDQQDNLMRLGVAGLAVGAAGKVGVGRKVLAKAGPLGAMAASAMNIGEDYLKNANLTGVIGKMHTGEKLNDKEEMVRKELLEFGNKLKDDDKLKLRVETRRAKERIDRRIGNKDADGNELGWFGRQQRGVRQVGFALGLNDQGLKDDKAFVMKMAGVQMAGMKANGKAPLGDIMGGDGVFGMVNRAIEDGLVAAGKAPRSDVLLAQAGFGSAGSTREDLQTQYLLNDPGFDEQKAEARHAGGDPELIKVLEKLNENLEKQNQPNWIARNVWG